MKHLKTFYPGACFLFCEVATLQIFGGWDWFLLSTFTLQLICLLFVGVCDMGHDYYLRKANELPPNAPISPAPA